MNWMVITAIATLIILFFLLGRFKGRDGKFYRRPYQKHTALFSTDDLAFFRPLKEAVGEEYEIFGKIRVGDIILQSKGTPHGDNRNAFNPLSGRLFDFLLCDKNTLAVSCAIQLYDKTNPARQNEQDPLAPICENLGLPLVRFHVKADYSVEEIRDQLRNAMVREPFYLLETDGRKEPRISNIGDIKF